MPKIFKATRTLNGGIEYICPGGKRNVFDPDYRVRGSFVVQLECQDQGVIFFVAVPNWKN